MFFCRCKLKNVVGVVLSKEVHVKAGKEQQWLSIKELSINFPFSVINQKYSVQVHDEYVISGNTAVLKCQVPSFVSDHVTVTAWIQNNGLHLYPNTDVGGKYNVLSNGDLCITNAGGILSINYE